MHRGYALISALLLSSLACGFITTVTPNPTRTSIPTEVTPTQRPTDTPFSKPAGTQTPVAKVTASPTQEEPTKTPFPTSVLDTQLTKDINLIQTQVIEERNLKSNHPVPVVLLLPDQLRQNVLNDFLVDYTDEESADDVMEYSTLGLLEPDFDFRGFYTELLSEQIAGYYDDEVDEMFVVQGETFQGPERMTYAHEYTHALQFQNYDIRNGLNYNDDACKLDSERCAAILALIEGDASLSEYIWLYYFATDQDRQQVETFSKSAEFPVYNSAPEFLKEDFLFPYTQGSTFVMDIFGQGGWSAVDDLYRNPPVSTEQILHPELYPDDMPIAVDLPDIISALGTGWREVSRNQMGEWYTYLILARAANSNARLDDTTAQVAAAGWGGDEYLLLHNDAAQSTAFVMKTIWDTTNDAAEFSAALQQYANIRFGVKATQQGDTLTWSYAEGFSSFYHTGDTTIWIITPESTTAQTISGLVQP